MHCRRAFAVAAVVGCLSACSSAGPPTGDAVPRFGVRIERTLPHDPSAFTQGLEIDEGRLIEGTGLEGQSRITSTDIATGEVVARQDLPAPLFGEGITRTVGDTEPLVWQLTWQDGTAFARDPDTLEEVRRVSYDGEGWGICALADGRLVTSDGSSTLTFRDPSTFDVLSTVGVSGQGKQIDRLNELECTPGGVLANVWQTDEIVRIDPASGQVTGVVDASPLRSALGADAGRVDVLNGIAAIPGTDRFLMTGKLWPSMFDVSLVPEES